MHRSAHQDTFARDNLPPLDQWPELVFDLPALRFPERMNCAHELLDRWVAQGQGDRACVIGGDGRGGELRWTYAELQAQANRIANVLVNEMGVVPGNRVLLRGANTPQMAACWFAVMKAGAIAVATMPLLRAKELGQVIEKARISHALCDAALAGELETARAQCPVLARVCLFRSEAADGLEALAERQSERFDNVDTASDDCALIAFTSGTTGRPKGTMHFHRDVIAICRCWPVHCLRANADDVFIGSPPLAFTFGLGGLVLFPLSVGASTVLLEKASPDVLLPAIAKHRATVCFTAPTSYRAMAAQVASHDLSSLRKCVSAGEALPAATRQLWKDATGIELIDGIGATELLHIFISHTEETARPGATGRPVPGYRARVVDDAGREVPAGTVGKLAVQGPTGCRYLADDRQAQYVRHGWNLTGDAYLIDADGYFVYQARTDDMIISGGYNIAGPEVESALLAHPAVAECAVVGVPDEERGQLVKAFVVLKPGAAGADDEAALIKAMQDFVKATIAPYKYPRAIEFRASLPRTETGKLQRFRLREA
ncbi:benzoate-CoA ligase family protein [Mitsuaria sp. TWR114]|uniref:benzoate-CoA ligase family protein n=1 Tax=Mitsuaria sp. TWR114 TaxID=2601731 RepID=UPI0011BFC9B0|nr:benzoate-CoA ligase family protein [Mitsuaria sp. TWR114]TXD75463.1 benzoate-CoA ligase family protein [Mitsuaria sp. TWR114]